MRNAIVLLFIFIILWLCLPMIGKSSISLFFNDLIIFWGCLKLTSLAWLLMCWEDDDDGTDDGRTHGWTEDDGDNGTDDGQKMTTTGRTKLSLWSLLCTKIFDVRWNKY